MPKDGSHKEPEDRLAGASKKTGGAPKAKGDEREARLAEALRANLRRRKAPNSTTDKKDD